MDYFVWDCDNEDSTFAWIKDFPNEILKNDWKLSKGISCKDWFPDNVELQIFEQYGDELTDSIPNFSNKLIISDKLKIVLEQNSNATFEFFPISIKNKLGQIIAKNYYIANLLDTVDCVDMDKSQYRMCPIVKDQVDRFSHLMFDEDKLDETKSIFRIKSQTSLIIIDDPLSDIILDADCTGMLFQELDDHGSVFRD